MIRLQRLQVKDAKPNPSTHLTLETLVEVAISLQHPESSWAATNLPNIEKDEQKDKKRKLKSIILEAA